MSQTTDNLASSGRDETLVRGIADSHAEKMASWPGWKKEEMLKEVTISRRNLLPSESVPPIPNVRGLESGDHY